MNTYLILIIKTFQTYNYNQFLEYLEYFFFKKKHI